MRTTITLLSWVLFGSSLSVAGHIIMALILLSAIGGDMRADALLRGNYEPPIIIKWPKIRRGKK